MPGCQVELFEGAGHFPHLDDPDRFADLVRDFIATTCGEDSPSASEA
jgi:pimeloyl-ACP methyl ester carboxylesterase